MADPRPKGGNLVFGDARCVSQRQFDSNLIEEAVTEADRQAPNRLEPGIKEVGPRLDAENVRHEPGQETSSQCPGMIAHPLPERIGFGCAKHVRRLRLRRRQARLELPITVLAVLMCHAWSLQWFERWAGPGGRGGEGGAGPPRAPHWRGGTNSGFSLGWDPEFGARVGSLVCCAQGGCTPW